MAVLSVPRGGYVVFSLLVLAGWQSAMAVSLATSPSSVSGGVVNTPWGVGVHVEAEDYDPGGEGVSYHDTTSGNLGGRYRSDDVDIRNDSKGEGLFVTAIATDEWLQYTLDVPAADEHVMELRVATPKSGRLLHIELGDVDVTGVVEVPNTGDWRTWQTLSIPVRLAAGRQVLRLVVGRGGFNMSWIRIKPVAPVVVQIEAEDYDPGGEGVSYHDTTSGNLGGRYRSDDVDIRNDSKGEGLFVTAIATDEWLQYTLDVPAADEHVMELRVATPKSGRLLHIELGDVDVTGVVEVPNTGDWRTWQTLSIPVRLAAGRQVLRLVVDRGGFNMSWIRINAGGGTAELAVSQPALPPEPMPRLRFSASPQQLLVGQSSDLSWSSSDAESCVAGGSWAGTRSSNGTQSVGPLVQASTFELSCKGAGGSVSRSVSIAVEAPPREPSVVFSAADGRVPEGSSTRLTWKSSDADSCVAGGGWSGARAAGGSEVVDQIDHQTTYTLTCRGPGGNAMAMISVSIDSTVTLNWQAPTENEDGNVGGHH